MDTLLDTYFTINRLAIYCPKCKNAHNYDFEKITILKCKHCNAKINLGAIPFLLKQIDAQNRRISSEIAEIDLYTKAELESDYLKLNPYEHFYRSVENIKNNKKPARLQIAGYFLSDFNHNRLVITLDKISLNQYDILPLNAKRISFEDALCNASSQVFPLDKQSTLVFAGLAELLGLTLFYNAEYSRVFDNYGYICCPYNKNLEL